MTKTSIVSVASAAERVDVVGAAEGEAAPERVPDPERLRDRRRHGEADEREPGEPGQDEERRQKRERQVDEDAGDRGGDGAPAAKAARR